MCYKAYRQRTELDIFEDGAFALQECLFQMKNNYGVLKHAVHSYLMSSGVSRLKILIKVQFCSKTEVLSETMQWKA